MKQAKIALKNVWNQVDSDALVARIEKLTANSQPLWGTMSVGKMLAHCNVTYECIYETKHPKPNPILKFILKLLVKNIVVNDKPYKKNSRTGPQFIIKETRDFVQEKQRLLAYLQKTFDLGERHFEGKESHSFGALSSLEWNNMFYKHLDHHLSQFGA
jgi:hypothetical protein